MIASRMAVVPPRQDSLHLGEGYLGVGYVHEASVAMGNVECIVVEWEFSYVSDVKSQVFVTTVCHCRSCEHYLRFFHSRCHALLWAQPYQPFTQGWCQDHCQSQPSSTLAPGAESGRRHG